MKLMHMPTDVIATDIIFCHIHAAATQYFISLLSSVSLLSIPNFEDSSPISPIAVIASGAEATCNCNCNILLYLCYATSLARLCRYEATYFTRKNPHCDGQP